VLAAPDCTKGSPRRWEEQCGDEPGERLGELAGHWARRSSAPTPPRRSTTPGRAAERALAQLAPDEAARWYRQALELHDQAPGGERSERCELLIGLGEAQRQVGNPEHRQTLLDAAGLAQELDDADRLGCAVLANNRGWTSQVAAGGLRSACRRSRLPRRPSRTAIRGGRVCLRWLVSELSLRRRAGALPSVGGGGDRDRPSHRRSGCARAHAGQRHCCSLGS